MIPVIITAGLLNLLLGIYVLIKNPRKRLNKLFAYMAFVISVWVFSNVMLYTEIRADYPFLHLTYAFGALIPPIIIHWVIIFTQKWSSQWFIFLNYYVSLMLSILSLIPGLLIRRVFEVGAYALETQFGFLFVPYAIIISFLLVASVFLLVIERSKSFGLKRLQINFALLGFGIPTLIIIFVDFIFPLIGDLTYYNFDSLTSFIFVGILTYSITRYRFLDIKVVIRKGLIYAVSLIIALAFYTYLAIIVKKYFEQSLNLTENWGIFVLILLVALGFPPLKNIVERSINALFKGKKSIDLAEEEVKEKMVQKTDVESLVELIVEEIKKFLIIGRVIVMIIDRQNKKFSSHEESLDFSHALVKYLEGKGEIIVREEIPHMLEADHGLEHEELKEVGNKMNRLSAEVAIPVGKGDEMIGLILLGKKQSRDAFTVEDIKFLETLSHQALFSLGNALLYRDAIERIKGMQT